MHNLAQELANAGMDGVLMGLRRRDWGFGGLGLQFHSLCDVV